MVPGMWALNVTERLTTREEPPSPTRLAWALGLPVRRDETQVMAEGALLTVDGRDEIHLSPALDPERERAVVARLLAVWWTRREWQATERDVSSLAVQLFRDPQRHA